MLHRRTALAADDTKLAVGRLKIEEFVELDGHDVFICPC